MKKIYQSFAILLIIFSSLTAQTPQAFKYQAIARNNLGNIISDQDVSIRISILAGSVSGTPVYIETHAVHTNHFGLANIAIGTGTGIGDFSSIDWGNDIFFIKTETDPLGGIAYTLMGVSQLLSVPYALHSKNTTNVNDADADPSNELQNINKIGNLVVLNQGGGSFVDEVNDNDTDSTNELQNINKIGNLVFLNQNGGSFIDEVKDNDADSTNELQKIGKIGNIVILSDSGGFFIDEVNDADHSPINEVQHLSLNGNDLSITAGNTITLPSGGLPVGTTGQTLRYSGGSWQANSHLYNDGYKIGIGTTSPVHRLDVYGSGITNIRISSTNHYTGLEFVRIGNQFEDYKFLNEGDQLCLYADTEDFQSTSYYRILSIRSNGNVGIGTTNPNFKLHVNNPSGTAIVANSVPDTSCAVFAASTEGIGLIAEHNDALHSNPAILATNYGAGSGIYAEANSASGEAVFGKASAQYGINRAIYGLTESADGYAGYFEGGKNYFEGNVGIGTTSSPYSLSIRSTSTNKSIYTFNRYSGSLDKFGVYSIVNSEGTGDKYGLYSQVDGNPAENNPLYGAYIYTNDNDNSGNTYGLYSALTATGTGDHYAIYASTNDGYAGYFEGGQNYFEGNVGIGTTSTNYSLNIKTSSSTRSISTDNQYSGSSNKFGIHNMISSDGTGDKLGIYTRVEANPADNSPSFGVYIETEDNGNSGDIFGLYSMITTSGTGNHYAIYASTSDGWAAFMNDGDLFVRDNVYIGNSTGASGYKVSIDGKVICEELKVQASIAWPDYVFNKDYPLTPIKELEKSIRTNKHLPGMPSAENINKEGITLGEMSTKQMEKIEELTLYIINMHKRIVKLETELNNLKNK
ncbi:MAG: hypothetical protein K8S00_11165 [Bacteroidales bacterium]|nr:hypothetical protein [Bacteroidales bacterium]